MHILILGKDGFLSQSLIPLFKEDGLNITCLGRKELDLSNYNDVNKFLKQNYYDIIINTAVSGGRRTKKDTIDDYWNNIILFNNLLMCNNLYGHLLFFGSGADQNTECFYGNSKFVNSIQAPLFKNTIQLRLFNVFGELGMKDSFIHTAINNNLNSIPIQIFENKFFDFFYIKDLYLIIKDLIKNPPTKYLKLDCVYKRKFTLLGVADIINNLSKQKVPVIINKDSVNTVNYCSFNYSVDNLGLKFVGLEDGIKNVINFICE